MVVYNVVLEVLANAVRQEKSSYTRNDTCVCVCVLLLFTDAMVTCKENPKEHSNK